MSIIWLNIPPRFWLWRHRNHAHLKLVGDVWSCSCGSSRPAAGIRHTCDRIGDLVPGCPACDRVRDRIKPAGDVLVTVVRSHAFYWRPRLRKPDPIYRWGVWWLRLYVGAPRAPKR